MYDGEVQIGLARVISDRATYACLCDVYVLEAYPGQGLGRWLMESVMAQPDRHMEIARPGLYRRAAGSRG